LRATRLSAVCFPQITGKWLRACRSRVASSGDYRVLATSVWAWLQSKRRICSVVEGKWAAWRG
jgi:hypothetical protein